MKNEGIRAAVGMFVFAAILLVVACITGSQNNSNSTNTTAGTTKTPELASLGQCKQQTTTANKIKVVQNTIANAVDQDGTLGHQHTTHAFEANADEYPLGSGIVRVFVNGNVYGEKKLKVLTESFDQLIDKDCVRNVTISSASAGGGFIYCESPCTPSGGACVCPSPQPMNTNTANSNTKGNLNSESNSRNLNSNTTSTNR